MAEAQEQRRGPDKGSARRGRGRLRQRASGRWQAGYTHVGRLFWAPVTFESKQYAEGWISKELRLIELDAWTPPDQREDAREKIREAIKAEPVTFGGYAEAWMARRTDPADPAPLAPTTAKDYRTQLKQHLLPVLGNLPLVEVTEEVVEAWYRGMAAKKIPRQRAKAYMAFSAIMSGAVEDKKIPVKVNPCRIKGASKAKPRRKVEPATLEELDVIVQTMPEPLRLAVLLGAWCALRYGEVFELRRGDIRLTMKAGNTAAGVIRVRRAVSWTPGHVWTDKPKTEAGVRDVAIPPHILDDVVAHLAAHAAPGPASLLFTQKDGQNVRPSAFQTPWHKARAAAGRDELHFHDLRHTGGTLAAQAGATVRELMDRLGHTKPTVAMIYQHTAAGRDQKIAEALAELAAPKTDAPPADDWKARAEAAEAQLAELRALVLSLVKPDANLGADEMPTAS